MTRDDFDALARLHAAAFAGRDRAWSAAELRALAAGAGAILLVEGAPPQGFALVRVAADEAELLALAVDPAQRRRGLGARLLARAEAAARAAGAGAMLLEVADGAAAALRLYARAGYAPVGRRRAYLRRADGGVEDAGVLRRDLGEAVETAIKP